MIPLSQSDFAKICNCSRQAVCKALKQDRLILTNGKIDPVLERLNAEFFTLHTEKLINNQTTESTPADLKVKNKPFQKNRNKKKEVQAPPESPGFTIEDLENNKIWDKMPSLSLLKKREDILLIKTRRAKIQLQIDVLHGTLIERDFFMSHVTAYLDVLSDQLFDLIEGNPKLYKNISRCIQESQRLIDSDLEKYIKEINGNDSREIEKTAGK